MHNILYGFFDYKEYLDYEHWSDFLKAPHLILSSCAILFIILFCIFFRKIDHKKIGIFLKILSILILINESTKIIWESYYDLKPEFRGEFNYEGLLPLYTCSMFIYCLIIAAWTKGKAKECALGFLTTLSIFAGLTNFLYLQILDGYPLWSYAALTSFFFHFFMVFTGIFLVSTGYYRPHMKDSLKAYILVVLFSIIVMPVNFILKYKGYHPNYMMYMDGINLPILENIEIFFTSRHLTLIYSFLVMGGYYLITIMVIGIYNLIDFIKAKCKQIKNKELN